MNKKIAYVHVGLEKCGSKSIQEALKIQTVPHSIVCDTRQNGSVEKLLETDNSTIYISDERLSWCDPSARKIVEMIVNAGYEIEAVAVFRNPLRYIESIYLEALKWGETKDFKEYLSENTARMDFSSVNAEIQSLFAEHRYSHLWLSPNIVNDLLTLFNLMPMDTSYRVHNNPKLGCDYSSILLDLNRLLIGVNPGGRESRVILGVMDKVIRRHEGRFEQALQHPNLTSINISEISKLISNYSESVMFNYGLSRKF